MIVPLVMDKTVELHPAILALGVVIIGQLFGLMGILLAVPLLAAIVILVQELWILPREASAEPSRAPAAIAAEARPRG